MHTMSSLCYLYLARVVRVQFHSGEIAGKPSSAHAAQQVFQRIYFTGAVED